MDSSSVHPAQHIISSPHLHQKNFTNQKKSSYYKTWLTTKDSIMNISFYEIKPHLCLVLGLWLCWHFGDNPIAKFSGVLLIMASALIYGLRWWHRKEPPVVKRKLAPIQFPTRKSVQK